MAGLKLCLCIALLSPTLAQVMKQQYYPQQRQMRGSPMGMRMAGPGAPPAMDELLDARADMMEARMMGPGRGMPSQFNNMMPYPNEQLNGYPYPSQQQQFQQYQSFNAFQQPAYIQVPSQSLVPGTIVSASNQIVASPVQTSASGSSVVTVEQTPGSTITADASGNIAAGKVIDMLRDLFTGMGGKTGVKKYVIV